VRNQKVGGFGEDMATHFLEEKGYQVLDRNVKALNGEIDLIATKGERLHFVEIKTRLDDQFGKAIHAIPEHKQKQIKKVAKALWYTRKDWQQYVPYYSVIAIDKNIESGTLDMEWIEDAFQ
jgi:putative endonuclease